MNSGPVYVYLVFNALVVGIVVGGIFALVAVYSPVKIPWEMSITALFAGSAGGGASIMASRKPKHWIELYVMLAISMATVFSGMCLAVWLIT